MHESEGRLERSHTQIKRGGWSRFRLLSLPALITPGVSGSFLALITRESFSALITPSCDAALIGITA